MDVSPGNHKRGTPLDKDGQEVKKTTRGWIYTCSELDFLRTVPYHYNAWSNSVLERYFFHPCVTSLLYKGLGSHLNRFYSHLALHVPRTVPPAFAECPRPSLFMYCSCHYHMAYLDSVWHGTLMGLLLRCRMRNVLHSEAQYCSSWSLTTCIKVVPRFRCLGRQTSIQDAKF